MSTSRRSFLKTLAGACLALPFLKVKASRFTEPQQKFPRPDPDYRWHEITLPPHYESHFDEAWANVMKPSRQVTSPDPAKFSEADFNKIFREIFAVSKKRGPRWMAVGGKWYRI